MMSKFTRDVSKGEEHSLIFCSLTVMRFWRRKHVSCNIKYIPLRYSLHCDVLFIHISTARYFCCLLVAILQDMLAVSAESCKAALYYIASLINWIYRKILCTFLY